MAGGRSAFRRGRARPDPATALTRTIRRLRASGRRQSADATAAAEKTQPGFSISKGARTVEGCREEKFVGTFSIIVSYTRSYTRSYTHGELLDEPSLVVNFAKAEHGRQIDASLPGAGCSVCASPRRERC